MRFLRRAFTGLVLAAATLALLLLALDTLRRAQETADGPPPGRGAERVFTAAVLRAEAGPVTPVITVFGEVQARRSLELRAPAGGRVVELAEDFRTGGSVRAGAVILRLDPAAATAARDLAAADLREAELGVDQAATGLALAGDDLAAAERQAALQTQALARQRDIRGRGAGSDAAVETAELALSAAAQAVLSRRGALAEAEAAVDGAAVTLDRARIALAEAERALADTVLSAPFDGTLAEVSVIPGALLSPNERLGDLIDPAALDVVFRLSNAEYLRLADAAGALPAAGITVSLSAGDARIETSGRILRVGAAVGEGQTGREVIAGLDAPAGLRPGDFVTVAVSEPPLDLAVRLPATALGADGAVLVLGPEDRLEAVAVRLLRRQGNEVILAPEGLTGREVVRDRAPVLGAGIRVQPVRPGQADAAAMVELSPERRAALMALVQADTAMAGEEKAKLLAQLAAPQVPAEVVARLEGQGG